LFGQSIFESIDSRHFDNSYHIEGYTRASTKTDDGTKIIIYEHPSFQEKRWYDWVYVHFEEIKLSQDAVEDYYTARILGFVAINSFTEAVIRGSGPDFLPNNFLSWSEGYFFEASNFQEKQMDSEQKRGLFLTDQIAPLHGCRISDWS
jgi:hypothetical protein